LKKKNEITNPHDATFKKMFGRLEIAKDVIAQNLPKEILDDIDLSTLEQLDGSFISEKLQETFSDIIYKVKIGHTGVYIALLLEHKSYTDKLTIFQVSRYIIDLWSKVIESGQKELPIVIPIVVYHGKGKWNYKTDARELIPNYHTLPKYLQDRLPVLKHDFVDITGHKEEDIIAYKPLTRMIIRSFKYIFEDKEKLIETFLISIEEAVDVVTDEELNTMIDIILLYYSATNKELTEEDFIRKIRKLDGKGEKLMTILQAREMRGIEKGRQEGMREGRQAVARKLLNVGLSIEQIAEAAELTEEEVVELKKETKSI